MRQNENSVSFRDDVDEELITRLAANHPQPHDLVAAMRLWITQRNRDESRQRQKLAELLYRIHESSADGEASATQAEWRTLWMDAELAGLGSSNTSATRGRMSKLSKLLLQERDWERLERMVSLSEKRDWSSFQQEEFAMMKKLLAFARGDQGVAWPVVWIGGDPAGEAMVKWQWHLRDVDEKGGDFEAAVSVADEPLVPEIEGQTKVEIEFGEMPSTMAVIVSADGNAAAGEALVRLPSKNGFLRAIATVGGERLAGPVFPVVSGRRIFPADGESLEEMLGRGEEPFGLLSMEDGRKAPDGESAVRIETDNERTRVSFVGSDYVVEPGKFYVLRGWVRRAGTGLIGLSGEYRVGEGKSGRPLNMILCDDRGTTDQWTYYARAVPTFSQHTFWLNKSDVESVVPRIANVNRGTEIAGFELVEVDGWKYGQWIGELAALREANSDAADQATLDRALELAGIEPLSALDYHGSWLVDRALEADRAPEVLELFRTAMAAEANPLFAKPKRYRIIHSLLTLADSRRASAAVRARAAEVGLGGWEAVAPEVRMGFSTARVRSIREQGEPTGSAEKELAKFLQVGVDNSEESRNFLRRSIERSDSVENRAVNRLVAAAQALGDPEVTAGLIASLNRDTDYKDERGRMALVKLALEADLPEWSANDEWTERVDAAFELATTTDLVREVVDLPGVLGDSLAANDAGAAEAVSLRRRIFELVREKNGPDDGKPSREIAVAGLALLESAQRAGDVESARDVAAKLVGPQPAYHSRGLLEEASSLLDEMGLGEEAAKIREASVAE